MALFTNVRGSQKLGKLIINCSITGLGKKNIHRWVAPTLREINRRNELAKPLPVEKTKRSNFIEWNYNAELFAFGKRLGEEFRIELLMQAFIHRSYIVKEELKQEQVGIENPNLSLKDNAVLAKEGEAIISAYVKRFLSTSLPRFPLEGVEAVHDHLLSDETLAHVSKNLGTTDIIFSAEYPVEIETFAKTLKAIVGALAQSQSKERAQLFVRDFILTQLAEQDLNEYYIVPEPLKALEAILARDGRGPLEPRLIGQSAMNDILANYTVGIYSDRQLIGQGPGETVDIALETAARDALKRLFRTADASAPIKFNIDDVKTSMKNFRLSEWRESAFEAR